MVEVLSCSDLHLGNFSTFNRETDNHGIGSRLQERIDALYDFFKYGKEHDIKHYIFNGDIFDKRLKEDINVINYIIDNIVKAFSIAPKGSVLYMNVGNHDESRLYLNPNSCELFNHVHIPNHKIVVVDKLAQLIPLDDDTNLLFIPYTEDITNSKMKIRKALSSLDKPTTVFAHIGLDKSHTGRYKRDLGGSYTEKDIGYDNKHVLNIVLGHYHTRDFHKGKNNSKEKSVWYQGNLLPMTFNDVREDGLGDERGFDVIDTKTGQHDFVDLCKDPYNYPTFNIIDLSSTKLSAEKINELAKNNYVKLVTPNKGKNELKEFNEETNENLTMVVKPQVTNEDVDINISGNDSVTDILIKYCESKKISRTIQKLALKILNDC